jgi:hypothetical protein
LFLLSCSIQAQTQQNSADIGQWQPVSEGSLAESNESYSRSADAAGATDSVRPGGTADPILGKRIATITTGSGKLPNEHGQIWREYDIRPYTLRVTTTNRPEQAMVDWILKVTGHEVWHTDPLGLFSASSESLRVYHTPAMQKMVADIVDRFVRSEAQTEAMALSIVTLDSPTWRGKAHAYLHPLPMQSSGGQAWMLTREDFARLSNDLARRSDYQQYSSQGLVVTNGQPTIVSSRRPRTYVRDVQPRPEVWPGYVTDSATLDEGYYLEFVPLLSLDGQWIEANLDIEITLVEKMLTFVIDMPTQASPNQRLEVQVPQVAGFRFEEIVRWPRDHVFLLDLGMIPMPKMRQDQENFFEKLASPLTQSRKNVLIFIESRGNLGNVSSGNYPIGANPTRVSPVTSPPAADDPGRTAVAPTRDTTPTSSGSSTSWRSPF